MSSTQVSVVRCDGYESEAVYRKAKEAVDLVGGMGAFVSRGDRVLIKPNLLSARTPDRAVLTHPAVVEAAIRLVVEAGGTPLVGDSPSIGSARSCAQKGEILPVLERYGVPLLSCETVAVVKNPDGAFKTFEVAKDALSVDKIINLPKLKTHGQMVMTLAVKNTFGLIPGARKTQWHLRTGNRPDHFARMLVDLHYLMRPVLSIIDGIMAMQGNGPGSGDPVDMGLVIAGADASAVDHVISRIVGLDPSLLYTLVEARKAGLGTVDPSRIEVRGERLGDVSVEGFIFPPTGPLMGGVPAGITRIARRILTPRPVMIPELCIECGRCEKVCPARAITGPPPQAKRRADKRSRTPGRMTIDYDRCIRCFCCQEICPEGAIQIRTGWFIRNKA
jgi:uncharacterized protein (DUF362 family)/NAD-dependent dihydropyrimidine dehydrogenase PreA subunit